MQNKVVEWKVGKVVKKSENVEKIGGMAAWI